MPCPLAKLVSRRRECHLHLTSSNPNKFSSNVALSFVLAYMHLRGAIHRDIKPPNVLIDPSSCSIKICDLGMSRVLPTPTSRSSNQLSNLACGSCYDLYSALTDDALTEYVVTRWYRSPEVTLSQGHYGQECGMETCLFDYFSTCPLLDRSARGDVVALGNTHNLSQIPHDVRFFFLFTACCQMCGRQRARSSN